MIICKHCDEEFNHTHPRHRAIGRINECADCAEDIAKTVAVIDGHGKSDVRIILQKNPKGNVNKELTATSESNLYLD